MNRCLLTTLVALSILFGILQAEDQRPDQQIQHLKSAAMHLQQAGFPQEAQELEHRINEMMKECQAQLKHKQSALKQLQREVCELQAVLKTTQSQASIPKPPIPFPQPRQLRSLNLKMAKRLVQQDNPAPPLSQMHCLIAEVKFGDKELSDEICSQKVLSRAEFEKFQNEMQDSWTVLSEPVLVTHGDTTASIHIGQQVPVVLPVSGSEANTEFRDVGIKIEAKVSQISKSRLKLAVATEITRCVDSGVKRGSFEVPGFNVQRTNVQAELNVGKTLLLQQSNHTTGKTAFIAVSPQLVSPIPPHKAVTPVQHSK